MKELRPSNVRFESETHQYWLGDLELKGITSTLIKRAYPGDYDGIPQDVLRKAAERGSNVHETIELYEDLGAESDLPELESYIRIKNENRFVHVASEYVVSDEMLYATAIDHVFEDWSGNIIIADIKTTYDKHYDKVALQLSICKRFFELQNPSLKVSRCALIWLRGERSEYKELTPWADEMLDDLIEADINDKAFDITTTYGGLPEMYAKVEDELVRLELEAKLIEERKKEIRNGFYDLMAKFNVKSYSGSKISLSRVPPKKSYRFDTTAFKKEHPDIYQEYVKEIESAGFVKITLK